MIELLASTVRNPDGSVNRTMATIAGVVVFGFILWRLVGSGTHDVDLVMSQIRQEIVQDYRRELTALMVAAQDAGKVEAGAAIAEPMVEEGGIEVVFKNVSVAAPLLDWGVAEEVVVRFHFELRALGEPMKSGQRYVRVLRGGFGHVRSLRESSAVGYYAKLFI